MDLPPAARRASGLGLSDMRVEIVLVPPDTEYAFVTRSRIAQPKLRFAFHYDPLAPGVVAARITRTYVHETKHILSALGELPNPNRESDEAAAVFMGTCAAYAQNGQLPGQIATNLPEAEIMKQIRATDYDDALERMDGSPPHSSAKLSPS